MSSWFLAILASSQVPYELLALVKFSLENGLVGFNIKQFVVTNCR